MTGNRLPLWLLIVLSGTIISSFMGMRQSLGLFQQPMVADVGITAAAFGFSIALQNITWGLVQPFAGAIADRTGPRPVLIACALIFAAGLATMTYGSALPGGLVLAGLLLGAGTSGFSTLYGAISRATAVERRSQVIGLVAAAGSIGTFVLAPLGGWMIGGPGWRAALLMFAAIAASMAVLSLPVKEEVQPAAGKKVPLSEALREALDHRGFVFMTLAFFACGFQLIFLTTHLPAYLALCGVAPGVSASALGLIGLFNAIGTYIFGLLGARYSQKHLLALIYLLRTLFIGAFLTVPVSAESTLVFAAAMGFLWLGVTPLVTGIIGRVFGLGHFNSLYGIAFLSHQVGSFFGAWMGGLVFTYSGNYNFAWGALIAVGLIAFTLQWMMDERPPSGRAAPMPA
jgi:MFS family permease